MKYRNILSFVHIRKMLPVRVIKPGFQIFFQRNIICTVFIHKAGTLKVNINQTCLVFLHINRTISSKLIQQIIPFIAQGHGSLNAAGLHLLDFKIELINTLADFVHTFHIIINLIIYIGLVFLKIRIECLGTAD